MSKFAGLPVDVIGLVLVGAEGCQEIEDQPWHREATPEETRLFTEHCRERIKETRGEQVAARFRFGDLAVDGSGRPYWLRAVLEHPDTPEDARQRAIQTTRCMRLVGI